MMCYAIWNISQLYLKYRRFCSIFYHIIIILFWHLGSFQFKEITGSPEETVKTGVHTKLNSKTKDKVYLFETNEFWAQKLQVQWISSSTNQFTIFSSMFCCWTSQHTQKHHVKQLFFETGVAMAQGSPFPQAKWFLLPVAFIWETKHTDVGRENICPAEMCPGEEGWRWWRWMCPQGRRVV